MPNKSTPSNPLSLLQGSAQPQTPMTSQGPQDTSKTPSTGQPSTVLPPITEWERDVLVSSGINMQDPKAVQGAREMLEAFG